MVRHLALASVLAGCSQLFGLDEGTVADADGGDAGDASDASDAAVPDAPAELLVQGTYEHRYARNGASLSPEVVAHDFTGAPPMIAVRLDDGSMPAVSIDGGAFAFARTSTEQSYQVTVTDLGVTTTYQHAAPTLKIVRRTAGRRDATGPRSATPISFTATSAVGQLSFVATTGQWSRTQARSSGPSAELTWDTASGTGLTPLGELGAAGFDTAYALETESIMPYSAVVRASAPTLISTGGAPVMLPPPSAIPRGSCVRIASRNLAALAGIKSVLARQNDGESADYRVIAVPAAQELGTAGEIWVALAPTSSPSDDEQVVEFAQPFPGHSYLASAQAIVSHSVALGGADPFDVSSLHRRVARFDGANGCPSLTSLDPGVGLAKQITIEGRELSSSVLDVLALPTTGTLAVDFTATGPIDVTTVTLYELGIDGGRTIPRLLERVVAVDLPVRVPSAQLVAGKQYVIELDTVRGVPGAAGGDLGSFTYPSEVARLWTPNFSFQ